MPLAWTIHSCQLYSILCLMPALPLTTSLARCTNSFWQPTRMWKFMGFLKVWAAWGIILSESVCDPVSNQPNKRTSSAHVAALCKWAAENLMRSSHLLHLPQITCHGKTKRPKIFGRVEVDRASMKGVVWIGTLSLAPLMGRQWSLTASIRLRSFHFTGYSFYPTFSGYS